MHKTVFNVQEKLLILKELFFKVFNLQILIFFSSYFQYIQVEDPVRRRTNNSLTAGATIKGQTQLQAMRGLILLPEEEDFGVLKEGSTYAFTLILKNTGVDTCRFKVKQPPPATGIRVIYKPGPVSFIVIG